MSVFAFLAALAGLYLLPGELRRLRGQPASLPDHFDEQLRIRTRAAELAMWNRGGR